MWGGHIVCGSLSDHPARMYTFFSSTTLLARPLSETHSGLGLSTTDWLDWLENSRRVSYVETLL
jgi:hypothetical protein